MPGEMRILVYSKGGERQIAMLSGGRMVEYVRETGATASWVGHVVLGTVEQVLPDLGAAFVDIGQRLNGFLPLREMESFVAGGHAKALVTGREVLAQVKKDAVGEKGAFLSRDITLPGQYALFMPLNRHVGVSGRLKDADERAKALELGKALACDRAGVIVRHAALSARQEDVKAEWEALGSIWFDILEKAKFMKAPAVLYQDASVLQAICRDYLNRYAIKLTANDVEAIKDGSIPEEIQQLVSDVEIEALWQGAGIPRQLEEALGRKVNLPGGGTLVIDEREALTTIDINSGRFVGGEGQGVALAQNLAACPEIARQIRLRNLSGILIVDFIDMEAEEEREKVMGALREALGEDRVKTVIHGFTHLGLLEMSRKRTRESLSQALTEPCASCNQTGRRPAHSKKPALSPRKGSSA